ncbi:MAG: hypothetical protein IJP01_05025, partial [Oscillospiraceae bacterium]|nr:hypothetical protein [Oscillospiraceae bacterium]
RRAARRDAYFAKLLVCMVYQTCGASRDPKRSLQRFEKAEQQREREAAKTHEGSPQSLLHPAAQQNGQNRSLNR